MDYTLISKLALFGLAFRSEEVIAHYSGTTAGVQVVCRYRSQEDNRLYSIYIDTERTSL